MELGPKTYGFVISVRGPDFDFDGAVLPPRATIWLGDQIVLEVESPWHSGPDAMREAYDDAASQLGRRLHFLLEPTVIPEGFTDGPPLPLDRLHRAQRLTEREEP